MFRRSKRNNVTWSNVSRDQAMGWVLTGGPWVSWSMSWSQGSHHGGTLTSTPCTTWSLTRSSHGTQESWQSGPVKAQSVAIIYIILSQIPFCWLLSSLTQGWQVTRVRGRMAAWWRPPGISSPSSSFRMSPRWETVSLWSLSHQKLFRDLGVAQPGLARLRIIPGSSASTGTRWASDRESGFLDYYL